MKTFDTYWYSFWISYYTITFIVGVKLMITIDNNWFYGIAIGNVILLTVIIASIRKLFKGE